MKEKNFPWIHTCLVGRKIELVGKDKNQLVVRCEDGHDIRIGFRNENGFVEDSQPYFAGDSSTPTGTRPEGYIHQHLAGKIVVAIGKQEGKLIFMVDETRAVWVGWRDKDGKPLMDGEPGFVRMDCSIKIDGNLALAIAQGQGIG